MINVKPTFVEDFFVRIESLFANNRKYEALKNVWMLTDELIFSTEPILDVARKYAIDTYGENVFENSYYKQLK